MNPHSLRKSLQSLLFVFLVLITFSSCSPSKKLQSTGNDASVIAVQNVDKQDGSSFQNAVVIKEKSESTGISAEYSWLAKNYPGYRSLGQSLVYDKNKPYDIIKIRTADGKEKEIYFDISNFFGKF
jgi:hypothetical protein